MVACPSKYAKSHSMHQIKTQLAEFSAAHRLIKGYVGKCQNLHGHNYRIFLTFGAPELDQHDFVTDFSMVKTLCNQWVIDHWDHAILANSDDAALLAFAKEQQQKVFVIENGQNTTVEVLAKHLFTTFAPLIKASFAAHNPGIQLCEVEIWETQFSCARYSE